MEPPLKHSLPIASALVLVLAACSPDTAVTDAAASAETESASELSMIEAGIYPSVSIEGELRQTLPERMAHYGVVEVSAAVYRDGELDWAKAWGGDADADTLFQAASLSKAVAATGIVMLAMERGVSLDADISGSLSGVDMAVLNRDGVEITLRGLLSHTNGATVGGFPGYAAGEPVPSNLEVVTGSDRTNTPAVTIEANPDGAFSYAGGGFQLAQLWAEQASGEDFAAMMDRLVLDPVGMTRSTFSQPLSEAIVEEGNIGLAYNWSPDPIEGGWHTYPEQAAAGLWTTPRDYGRFVMALTGAMKGEADTGISAEAAKEITQAVSDTYGLGIGVEEKNGEAVLRHSGSNEGYKSYFEAYPERGDAIVVMSGSAGSFPLNADITRTAKIAYDWPISPLRTATRYPLSAEELAAFAGRYAQPGVEGRDIVIRVNAPNLTFVSSYGAAFTLIPTAADTFMDPDDGQTGTFAETDGVMTLTADDTVFQRIADE